VSKTLVFVLFAMEINTLFQNNAILKVLMEETLVCTEISDRYRISQGKMDIWVILAFWQL
jgi:hypothetical protein